MRLAHDLNNLLSIILASGETLLATKPGEAGMRECVNDILDAGFRASDLAHRFIATCTADDAARARAEVVDVNQVIEGVEALLRRLAGSKVHLVFDLAATPAYARVGPPDVERILLNLVANARDAMPAGGSLRIGTEIRVAPQAARPSDAPGLERCVVLTVADSGCGMDPETRDRIFTPFFTTKPGHGTGLGLSTVRTLVAARRGFIEVETAVGVGTVFRLFFPHEDSPSVGFAPSGSFPIPENKGGF
jgi:two-component system cell cycle sensor histidine kinase/response regulator CckA